jgi:hypothetical protein
MVPTLFGSARDTSFSDFEVGAGMNTIAIMATAAIKPPTAIIPKHILANRPRFWLSPDLRICAYSAPCKEWALGIGLWLTRPSAWILVG